MLWKSLHKKRFRFCFPLPRTPGISRKTSRQAGTGDNGEFARSEAASANRGQRRNRGAPFTLEVINGARLHSRDSKLLAPPEAWIARAAFTTSFLLPSIAEAVTTRRISPLIKPLSRAHPHPPPLQPIYTYILQVRARSRKSLCSGICLAGGHRCPRKCESVYVYNFMIGSYRWSVGIICGFSVGEFCFRRTIFICLALLPHTNFLRAVNVVGIGLAGSSWCIALEINLLIWESVLFDK